MQEVVFRFVPDFVVAKDALGSVVASAPGKTWLRFARRELLGAAAIGRIHSRQGGSNLDGASGALAPRLGGNSVVCMQSAGRFG